MPPADPGQSEYEADARGIMQCLRMLTEEAAEPSACGHVRGAPAGH